MMLSPIERSRLVRRVSILSGRSVQGANTVIATFSDSEGSR